MPAWRRVPEVPPVGGVLAVRAKARPSMAGGGMLWRVPVGEPRRPTYTAFGAAATMTGAAHMPEVAKGGGRLKQWRLAG